MPLSHHPALAATGSLPTYYPPMATICVCWDFASVFANLRQITFSSGSLKIELGGVIAKVQGDRDRRMTIYVNRGR